MPTPRKTTKPKAPVIRDLSFEERMILQQNDRDAYLSKLGIAREFVGSQLGLYGRPLSADAPTEPWQERAETGDGLPPEVKKAYTRALINVLSFIADSYE